MAFKLVCTEPFHGYVKGQEVTDPAEVAKLMDDREHHFVRVAVPDVDVGAQPVVAQALPVLPVLPAPPVKS